MLFNHSRIKIVSRLQHLYSHSMNEFLYGNSALPGVTNAQEAIDWIISVLYPNTKPAVATPADLPTGLNTPNVGDVTPTINDYRIVNDNGAGQAAGYLYVKYDTDVSATWHKVYDFNWGVNQVLQGLVSATQPLYFKKYGSTDYDPITTNEIVGVYAGQSIFGGEKTNQNLTLHANNFDGTGYVQFNDNTRPTINSTFSLGTTTERFLNIFTDSIISGTTTISAGSITDTSGTVDFASDTIATLGLISSDTLSVGTSGTIGSVNIGSTITTVGGTTSFSADNILTTGNINGAIGTFTSGAIGDFSIGTGTLTSLSATIDFGLNNLTTTGIGTVSDLQATTATIGTMSMSASQIASVGNITLSSPSVDLTSALSVAGLSIFNDSMTVAATKTQTFTGGLIIDSTGLDMSGGNLLVNGNIIPKVDATYTIGSATNSYIDLYLSGALKTSTDQYALSELFRFNGSQFQDVAKTTPVSNGDILKYDSVSGKWLASSSIGADHLTLLNINGGPNGDGGHNVFPKLAGRTGGQVISGGIIANELLTLQNNSVDNIGVMLSTTEIKPNIDATISLGSPVLRYTDIYMGGVADGLRVKSDTVLASFDTYLGVGNAALDGKIGKLNSQLYINNGGVKTKVGLTSTSFTIDLTSVASVTTDVSATFNNPQNVIWQLSDAAGNIVYANIQATATSVIISRDAAVAGFPITVLGIEV